MASQIYPDISDILARKAEARLERAKMPFGQKILILEKMRREIIPLREAMHRHRAQKAAGLPNDAASS